MDARPILVPARGAVTGCQIKGFATADTVVNQRVVEWTGHCGTYGMGGPGFFGLRFETEDWLILRIWGSMTWLHIGDRIIEGQASANNSAFKPMFSAGQQRWDHVTPALNLPQTIKAFDFQGHSGYLAIGDTLLEIKADPKSRPTWAGNRLRQFTDQDDLREGWIIATQPWVQV